MNTLYRAVLKKALNTLTVLSSENFKKKIKKCKIIVEHILHVFAIPLKSNYFPEVFKNAI